MTSVRVRRWIAGATALLAAAGLAAAPAATAGPSARSVSLTLTWSAPTLVDPEHGFTSISCVSRKLCRAGDAGNRVERWDGRRWTHGTTLPPAPTRGIVKMSCTSDTFCAAVQLLRPDGFSVDRYRPIVRLPDGQWNVSAAIVPTPDPYATAPDLSCVAKNFCMLVATANYQIWNGTTWSAPRHFARYPSLHESVSCVTASMCLMASGYGDVYRWNGSTWSGPKRIAGSNVLREIDCATTTSCTIVTEHGALRWNGSTWGPVVVFDPDRSGTVRHLTDVSCPITTFCEAVDSRGYAFTFTAGSGWGGGHRLSPPNTLEVSCSSSAFCVAISQQGYAIHRVDGTWQAPRAADLALGRNPHVGCDVRGRCVVVDFNGGATAFTGSFWTTPQVVDSPPPHFVNISCAGISFCMAAGVSGQIRIRDHGTWGNGIPVTSASDGLTSVSCGTLTLCTTQTAVRGTVFMWNGSTFRAIAGGSEDNIYSDDCGSDGCVVEFLDIINGGAGTVVYRADGTTQTFPPSDSYPSRSMSCVTVSFCMKGSQYFDGSKWVDVPGAKKSGGGGSGYLSCATTTFCVSVGGRSASVWEGTSWSEAETIVGPEVPGFAGLSSLSCRPTICVAVDPSGWAVVGTRAG